MLKISQGILKSQLIINKSQIARTICLQYRLASTDSNLKLEQNTSILKKKDSLPYYYEIIYEGPINNTIKGFKYIGNSLFLVSFFASPLIYLYGEAPVLGSFFVAICGILPSYYTHLQTRGYVSRLEVRQPLGNQKKLTPSSLLRFETMGIYGQKVLTLGRIKDVKIFSGFLTPENIKVISILENKEGREIEGLEKKFFLEAGRMGGNQISKTLWESWKGTRGQMTLNKVEKDEKEK